MADRFTIDGSDTLERHLAVTCERIRDGLREIIPAHKLQAVMVGGGYGRGEGGVLRTAEGDRPYNDLESFVCVRGPVFLSERRFRHACEALGHRLSPDAGLEVEFKLISLEQLRRSPTTMFYYDLVSGHRWLVGDETTLTGCERHRDAANIPLSEATRLLMNRCSGLLFAKAMLEGREFGAEESDFVARNIAKAQLALGDAWLTAHGNYHWSCRERAARLHAADQTVAATPPSLNVQPPSVAATPSSPQAPLADSTNPPWLAAIREQHATGVEFKLHPLRSNEGRDSLAQRHAEVSELSRALWLWLEARRLGAPFASARDYALHAAHKCPETAGWRNRLINTRAFGPANALGAAGGRYLRDRILRALPLLLWDSNALTDATSLAHLQTHLRTRATDLAGLIPAYRSIWTRCN